MSELYSAEGLLKEKYKYTAYGKRDVAPKPFISHNEYGYRGEAHTADSLQYLRARYYDNHSETFIQMDTYRGETTHPLSQNRYDYGLNNPYKYHDPTGHKSIAVRKIPSPVKNIRAVAKQAAAKKAMVAQKSIQSIQKIVTNVVTAVAGKAAGVMAGAVTKQISKAYGAAKAKPPAPPKPKPVSTISYTNSYGQKVVQSPFDFKAAVNQKACAIQSTTAKTMVPKTNYLDLKLNSTAQRLHQELTDFSNVGSLAAKTKGLCEQTKKVNIRCADELPKKQSEWDKFLGDAGNFLGNTWDEITDFAGKATKSVRHRNR